MKQFQPLTTRYPRITDLFDECSVWKSPKSIINCHTRNHDTPYTEHFSSVYYTSTHENVEQFIPYCHERDKLGKLIIPHYQSNPQVLDQHFYKRYEYNEPSEYSKIQRSKDSIQRIFNLKQIPAGKVYIHNIKVTSPRARKPITPQIGYYSSCNLRKNIIYPRSSVWKITPPKLTQPISKHKRHKSTNLQVKKQKNKPQTPQSQQDRTKQYQSTLVSSQGSFRKKKLNYDLAELRNYHQLKLYKLKLCDNFLQGHLKFKQKVKYAQNLANRIRKDLDKD